MRVRLNVTPGTAGPNHFAVAVADFDTGRAVAADRVSLRLTPRDRADVPAATVALQRRG